MKVNILKNFLVSALIVITGVMSSCDYLSIEKYIENDLKLDSVFTQRRTLEDFMWGITTYLPFDEGGILGGSTWNKGQSNVYSPGPLATDEGFVTWPTGGYPGMAYVMGEINANRLGTFDRWGDLYKAIRQCNLVLARMNECKDCLKVDEDRVRGYTLFMRAYAYYNLLMMYGPVILIGDEVIANNETLEFYDRELDTYDKCINYIC